MRKILIAIVVFTELLVLCGCVSVEKEKELAKFILSHVEKIEPLTIRANVAYWDASTTGKSEDYDKLSRLSFKLRYLL